MHLSFIYPAALWLLLIIPPLIGLALLGRRRPTRARFWVGLVLRSLLLLALILSLAGMQVRTQADQLTVVFVVDASDSVPAAERAQAVELIRTALREMPRGDLAAVVVFGSDALVERLASEERGFATLESVPDTTRTNIATALQLAMALFPAEGAKRLVLLSDGQENIGHALDQAQLAAAHEVQIVVVPLGGPPTSMEVLLDSLESPADVRQGQRFDLTAHVRSTARVAATLRVFADGKLVHSQDVSLQPGSNRFLVPLEAGEPGFHRYWAQIVPEADTLLQNNEAAAFTVVHGPPRVLLVEGSAGEADNLATALVNANVPIEVVAPEQIPVELAELAGYDAVVLINVPAEALPQKSMESLEAYVRDLGHGLGMVGGETAYGAGGYLRTPLEKALPVDMDVRSKERTPNLALVLAVDKSGSMARCHCSSGPLDRAYERVESGLPKVDIAKDAVVRAAEVLGPLDYLGVVAFDEQARWALEVGQLVGLDQLEAAIGSIRADGQTNIFAGLSEAEESLRGVDARIKHIILLTDGWSSSGDYAALIQQMAEEGITLSVVAAGGGSADYLQDLANQGGGRYYPAPSIHDVPQIFLKETVTAVGSYIIEEPFLPLPGVPSPLLKGLDVSHLPPLLGYNGTTPKEAARVALFTARGDPLLATWQYGLGRAAAWTSDTKGQWASEWVQWEEFPRFAAQFVGWLLPQPQSEGMDAQVTLDGAQVVVSAEAVDEQGQPRNFLAGTATLIGPNLETTEVDLRQVAAGRYESRVELGRPGTYMVQVALSEGDQPVGRRTAGLVVPYSPEYRSLDANPSLLYELARATGGAILAQPADAFVHDLPATERAHQAWPTLLLSVALLFPLDVALRRVMLGPRDLRRAGEWVRERIPARRQVAGEPILGQLFTARERVRERRRHEATWQTQPPNKQSTPPAPGEDERRPAEPTSPPPVPSPSESLARLQEAKKRARK
ncbi:MAG: VWA domain-containing protein [Chloroflexota bacterium]|nr:VWA domain-containing protein [Chloroflexota bacterium]